MNISFLLLVVLLLLAGCTDSSSLCSFEEVQSEVSEGDSVKAVVMTKDCGATTSKAYHIFLSPVEGAVDKENPIFVADKVNNLEVLWRSRDELLITYDSARIFQFKNFYYLGGGGPEGRVISILEIRQGTGIDF